MTSQRHDPGEPHPKQTGKMSREQTDKSLRVERDSADEQDRLNADLREANERMVAATLDAQEQKDLADAARGRAEQTEVELRELSEFREMFIGMLGHDLRNPLSSIKMSAGSLLRRGRLDEQDAGSVTRIVRASQRMTEMISQLLDLTRARLGGGLVIEARPADLEQICRGVVEEFGAQVELEVEGDLTGDWDPGRLAQAISNVVGNAAEYAKPGTTVRVKARAEGPEVIVSVSNEGAAIPPDVLPFIFEPFRRAHGRKQSVSGNLGLGLYISHQIVQSHGGTISAHSADGTTTFELRLPRAPQQGAVSGGQ